MLKLSGKGQSQLKLSGNGNECEPLPTTTHFSGSKICSRCESAVAAAGQGLTLVHFSAQLERFVWDRGCTSGVV